MGSRTRCMADPSFISSKYKERNRTGFHFYTGDLIGYSGAILAIISIDDYPDAMSDVVDRPSRTQGVDSADLASLSLRLAFGPSPNNEERLSFEQMNDVQRQIVTILAERDDETWKYDALGSTLREWNIPVVSREELQRFAGLPAG
ncbi:hypothetical protein N7522_002044 [Penicillium canescens]|nr:uncharacterized protein N7446_000014 [Penicillium canescens]KAJ6011689.1 hypothetical protein N7522_002044 [Penicillium canescens]KAJ6077078.1 hypothetical protein N7446_000014 [Penicillium canescens]